MLRSRNTILSFSKASLDIVQSQVAYLIFNAVEIHIGLVERSAGSVLGSSYRGAILGS